MLWHMYKTIQTIIVDRAFGNGIDLTTEFTQSCPQKIKEKVEYHGWQSRPADVYEARRVPGIGMPVIICFIITYS